jgi:hypothetical protein
MALKDTFNKVKDAVVGAAAEVPLLDPLTISIKIQDAQDRLARANEQLLSDEDHLSAALTDLAMGEESDKAKLQTVVDAAEIMVAKGKKAVDQFQRQLDGLHARRTEATKARNDRALATQISAVGGLSRKRLEVAKRMADSQAEAIKCYSELRAITASLQTQGVDLPADAIGNSDWPRLIALEIWRLNGTVQDQIVRENGGVSPINWDRAAYPGGRCDDIRLRGNPAGLQPLVDLLEERMDYVLTKLRKESKASPVAPATQPAQPTKTADQVAAAMTPTPAPVAEVMPKGRTMTLAEATAAMSKPKIKTVIDHGGRGRT